MAILSRFVGLAHHFSHIDDVGVAKTILDAAIIGKQSPFWSVSVIWTFAPLQFICTALLINFEQSYRELLFWGRLPSFVVSVAGIFAAYACLLRLRFKQQSAHLIALALLACSWQAIIYAKQMNNYAFGLTGAWLMLVCLCVNLNASKLSYLSIVLQSAFLAGLCYAHYQLFFLVPAYYLALFFFRRNDHGLPHLCMRFAAGAAVLIAVLWPLYSFFFSKVYDPSGVYNGLNYNVGPAGKFLFSWPEAGSLAENIRYSLTFFLNNFPDTLYAMLAFVPDRNALSGAALKLILCLLVAWGGVRLFKERKTPEGRLLFYYLFFSLLFWILLVILQKLTLSPTRHSMIYIPMLILCAAKGAEGMASFFGNNILKLKPETQNYGMLFTAMVIVFLFSASYHVFLKERKDPFNEKEILAVLSRFDADALISFDSTVQPGMMKSLRDYFGHYDTGHVPHDILYRSGADFDRIAWVSHRSALSHESWAELYKNFNLYVRKRTPFWLAEGKQPPMPVPRSLSQYRTLYSKEISSDVEIDYSRQTLNGYNGFFFYVLERKPAV